ncbi:hypothetical protein QQZ08_010870 [Neonectria magnoliae]|uniref:Uncharacterized protein n=1 Tax=Neonectria magnoliae TaxID=2732573 RepID=A0ABR1HET3_9HYPO
MTSASDPYLEPGGAAASRRSFGPPPLLRPAFVASAVCDPGRLLVQLLLFVPAIERVLDRPVAAFPHRPQLLRQRLVLSPDLPQLLVQGPVQADELGGRAAGLALEQALGDVQGVGVLARACFAGGARGTRISQDTGIQSELDVRNGIDTVVFKVLEQ